MICAPTVIDGFNAVIGSWKTIEISLPRMRDSAASVAERRSTPLSLAEPPLIRAGGVGTSPISDWMVTLFPLPDSPTIASTSPRSSVKLTSLTASTSPA